MVKDPYIESLLGTTFYFEHLKNKDENRTRELANRAFLGAGELVDSISKELSNNNVRFDVMVAPYTAASVLGTRWTFKIRDDNAPPAILLSDYALSELFFDDPASIPLQLDIDAFKDDESIRAKACIIATSWFKRLQTCLSAKSTTAYSELSLTKCICIDKTQMDSDILVRELNTFVAEMPLTFSEGGILALQYEAQMMAFLHKHRFDLGLESSIPKPIIPGQADKESSTETERQNQQKSDLSILQIIEKNHRVGFQDILSLYFGISPNSPIQSPMEFMRFQKKLLSLNMFFVPMIYRPCCDMVTLWRRLNLIHIALTSLSHQSNDDSFEVEWHKNYHLGVINHSTFVRNLNEGLKYPNIRMSGLADFEHICRAQRNHYGLGLFTKSMIEMIILCVSSCLTNNCSIEDTATILKIGLSEVLANTGRGVHKFNETWEREKLDELVGDVKEGQKLDQLLLRRIVRASELFVLTLEGIV